MIWILLLTSGLLSLVHYLGIEAILVKALEIPLPYYISVLLGIVAIRIILSFIRYFLIAREYFRKIIKLFRLGGTKSLPQASKPSSPGSGVNQKRGFSTQSIVPSRPVTAKIAKSQLSILQEALKKYNLQTKVVKDNFFRVINKLGTLVNLPSGKPQFNKSRPSLLALFKKVGFRLIGACFPGLVKFRARLNQLVRFHAMLRVMTYHHGPVYAVTFLKLSQLALQKAIAGNPVKTLRALDPGFVARRLSKDGLPRFIPTRDARLILNKGYPIIRWYLSLLSVYRVIYIPGKLKLGTITDGLTVPIKAVELVASELTMLVPLQLLDVSPLAGTTKSGYKVGLPAIPGLPMLESASSTMSVSWLGYVADILALSKTGKFDELIEYCELTGQLHYKKLMQLIQDVLPQTVGSLPWTTGLGAELSSGAPIGKLSLKEEAAGKVRVFAMVTCWDQAILRSLHDYLFRFLRSLENDGTFDQHASVKRCMEKSMKTGCSFGYDLSAATDRLPLLLQSSILNKVLPGLGTLWGQILVGRDYHLATKAKSYVHANGAYRYSVGQPMGALSSWGMLAVTHHLLAQLAAYRFRVSPEGRNLDSNAPGGSDPYGFWNAVNWYEGYEVLGDDIVFFEEGVARHYLDLMTQIGVPINLGKSVVANNPTFEFAKVTGHYGHHVAAISWAMFAAQPTAMGRVGICFSLLRKGIANKHVIRYITTLSRESRYSVGKPNLFLIALSTMLAKNGWLKLEQLLFTIIDHDEGRPSLAKALLLQKPLTRLTNVLPPLLTGESTEPMDILISPKYVVPMSANTSSIKTAMVYTIQNLTYGVPAVDNLPFGDIDIWRSLGVKWHKEPINPQRDAAILAKEVLSCMVAAGPDSRALFRDSLEKEGAFVLKPKAYEKLSPVGCLAHILYLSLYTSFYESLLAVWVKVTAVKPGKLKYENLDTLTDLISELDTYHRSMCLVRRMTSKVSKEEVPSKNLVESPLKILEQILKAESMVGTLQRIALSYGADDLTRLSATGQFSTAPVISDEKEHHSSSHPNIYHEIIGYIGPTRVIGKNYSAPEFPKYYPWNYLAGQTDYLYCLTGIDYLYEKRFPSPRTE